MDERHTKGSADDRGFFYRNQSLLMWAIPLLVGLSVNAVSFYISVAAHDARLENHSVKLEKTAPMQMVKTLESKMQRDFVGVEQVISLSLRNIGTEIAALEKSISRLSKEQDSLKQDIRKIYLAQLRGTHN